MEKADGIVYGRSRMQVDRRMGGGVGEEESRLGELDGMCRGEVAQWEDR